MTETGERNGDRGKWVDRAWRRAWPAVVLAMLCAAFYWDALRLPASRIVSGNDLSNMFLQWLRFAVTSLRKGQLPLWNPYLFSGIPFVANPQPALFYPPTWLALLLPVTTALGWIIVLHVWLAAVGMYAWMRSEGASAAGALRRPGAAPPRSSSRPVRARKRWQRGARPMGGPSARSGSGRGSPVRDQPPETSANRASIRRASSAAGGRGSRPSRPSPSEAS